MSVPRALTIAGSDSGGGAGIQADLKTFDAFGVYGATAVTALTAQNTLGVRAVQVSTPELLRAQIEAVVGDIGVDAAKTGMLATAELVDVVVDAVHDLEIPNLVVDPVMVAKGGDRLLDEDAVERVRDGLVPLARCITPNLPEAEALLGEEVPDLDAMRQAASALCRLGPEAALITGGHLDGDPVDVLCDGGEVMELRSPRIDTPHTHGTGCTLSAGIAAGLARGRSLERAVRAARDYLQRAIEAAPGLGRGHGPVQHGVDA